MMGANEGDREPAEWMELPFDHEILEMIRDCGPFGVHEFEQMDGDLHDVLNRVQILVGYGLVQKRLSLTGWGAAHLDGERSGEEFEMS